MLHKLFARVTKFPKAHVVACGSTLCLTYYLCRPVEAAGNPQLTNASCCDIIQRRDYPLSNIEELVCGGPVNMFMSTLERHPEYVNRQNERGDTLLMIAFRCKRISIIKYLLSVGADVNLQNKNGNTVLMEVLRTVEYDYFDIEYIECVVKMLLAVPTLDINISRSKDHFMPAIYVAMQPETTVLFHLYEIDHRVRLLNLILSSRDDVIVDNIVMSFPSLWPKYVPIIEQYASTQTKQTKKGPTKTENRS